jgi:hypothetical protein
VTGKVRKLSGLQVPSDGLGTQNIGVEATLPYNAGGSVHHQEGTMLDSLTKKPIEVIDDGDEEPYILVQLDQLELVKKLLDDAGFRYSVHDDEYSVNGKPYIAWIDVLRLVDVPAIQRLLDANEAPKLNRPRRSPSGRRGRH